MYFTQDYNVLFDISINANIFSSRDMNPLKLECEIIIWLAYEFNVSFHSLSNVLHVVKHNNAIATIVIKIRTPS